MMRDDAAQWDEISWDEIIQDLPGAHILQTQEWGQFKAAHRLADAPASLA